MAWPQRVHSRWRAGVPHIFHQWPRRRGDGHYLELPRPDGARASGDVGGLAGRLSSDTAVQVVELARQLWRRDLARPEVGRYDHRSSRSRCPKARRRGERMFLLLRTISQTKTSAAKQNSINDIIGKNRGALKTFKCRR